MRHNLTLQDTDPMPLGPLVKYVPPAAPVAALPPDSPWVEAPETMPSDERVRPMLYYTMLCASDPLGQVLHKLSPGEALPKGGRSMTDAEAMELMRQRGQRAQADFESNLSISQGRTIKFRRWVPPSERPPVDVPGYVMRDGKRTWVPCVIKANTPAQVGVDLAGVNGDASAICTTRRNLDGSLHVLDLMGDAGGGGAALGLRRLAEKLQERMPKSIFTHAAQPKPPMFEKGERVYVLTRRDHGRVVASLNGQVEVYLESGAVCMVAEADLEAELPF